MDDARDPPQTSEDDVDDLEEKKEIGQYNDKRPQMENTHEISTDAALQEHADRRKEEGKAGERRQSAPRGYKNAESNIHDLQREF
jgi:hypothetical protein